jgi:hypothetical protein
MRRSILLVLVAALALAVGINAPASAAGDGGAQAAAKKKAAKCKAKPKKKGKAGQVVGAAAKKKAAKCKAKPKPKPKAPAKPLGDGYYEDAAKSVKVTVSGGGKSVEVGFPTSCFLFSSETVPLGSSGDALKAGDDRDIVIAGIPGHVTWALTIKSTLAYTLSASFQVESCTESLPVSSGKLVKKG